MPKHFFPIKGLLSKAQALFLCLALLFSAMNLPVIALADEETVSEAEETEESAESSESGETVDESSAEDETTDEGETDASAEESDESGESSEDDLGEGPYAWEGDHITYDEFVTRYQEFIAKPEYADGASWTSWNTPLISNWTSYGCMAYAMDFVAYVYGVYTSPEYSDDFTVNYDLDSLKVGDIVHVSNNSGHWFVILDRQDDVLYTCDGNFGSVCRTTTHAYHLENGGIYDYGACCYESFDFSYQYTFREEEPLKVSETDVVLTVKETKTLTAFTTKEQSLTWTSDDPTVATVENGVITAKHVGTTVVRASVYDGAFSVACNVKVLFKDVKSADKYYYDPVYWAAANGITTGRSGGEVFDPGATCTRAEIVTFLWRLAGCPDPESSVNIFADVPVGSYFEKSVQWAYEQGITTGRRQKTSDGSMLFDPGATCSRREIVTFLWRYAGEPAPSSEECEFSDINLTKKGTKPYYYDAVLWAVEQGITTGKAGQNRFDPLGECTRGMSVTFIFRYAANE